MAAAAVAEGDRTSRVRCYVRNCPDKSKGGYDNHLSDAYRGRYLPHTRSL